MKWLIWSVLDLEKGLGGVEVHCRSLARELQKRGIIVEFSSNPQVLADSQYDVLNFHGSSTQIFQQLKYFSLGRRDVSRRALRVFTLHGTTLGRMRACGEWFWPRGYLASLREMSSLLWADVVMAVHSDVSLLEVARRLGKTYAICGNGWDAGGIDSPERSLSTTSSEYFEGQPYWCYIGRGRDPVKAVERIHVFLKKNLDHRLVTIPGGGFESCSSEQVIRTGVLDSVQTRKILNRASGLWLTSKYEGYPIVVLEALSLGVPVVSTYVGGVRTLPHNIQGFCPVEVYSEKSLEEASQKVQSLDLSLEGRACRAAQNQAILSTWMDVANHYLRAVEERMLQQQ